MYFHIEVVDKRFKELKKIQEMLKSSEALKLKELSYMLHSVKFLALYGDSELLGFLYLSEFENLNNVLYIHIKEEYRNKGYACEFLKKVISENNKKKIVYFDSNQKISFSLFRKLGFVEADYYFYDLQNNKVCIMYRDGIFDNNEFMRYLKKVSNGFVKPNLRQKY